MLQGQVYMHAEAALDAPQVVLDAAEAALDAAATSRDAPEAALDAPGPALDAPRAVLHAANTFRDEAEAADAPRSNFPFHDRQFLFNRYFYYDRDFNDWAFTCMY